MLNLFSLYNIYHVNKKLEKDFQQLLVHFFGVEVSRRYEDGLGN